jgi:SAM-dependent methyltransferase
MRGAIALTMKPSITPDELRAAVRDRYSAVATEPRHGYSFRVGREFAEALGYPSDLLATVPDSAIEAFTGVATPIFMADLRPGESVVDLGCGAGLDLVLAARIVGDAGSVTGVDMAPAMVARARQTIDGAGLTNARVFEARVESLPLEPASVDCAIANGILNLSPDKGEVLREVGRVLKPGGRFILAETTLRHELPPDSVTSIEDWFR